MPQSYVERGRRAYGRREWKDAHTFLSLADRESALHPADLERLATDAFLIGREKEFDRALERAHLTYRDAGDRRAARCAFWIGLRLFLSGETAAATRWWARGQRVLDQEGRASVDEGYLLLPVAEQHLRAGELDRAVAVAREATSFGTRLGDRDLIAAARHAEGKTLLEMGQLEAGFALLDEAMVEVMSGDLSPMMTGLVYRLRGQLDAAESAYRSASRAGAEPQPGLALVWLARGRTRAAAAAIGRALDETVEPLGRARFLPARIEILLAVRDREGASAACAELAEIATRFHIDILGATVAQAQGALELATGNPREALVRLRLAWKEWQALEIPHAAARTRELLGLACRALGDRAGGRMELEAARADYERLGAASDIVRIDALLAHRAGAGPNGLTAREAQVLRLVAAGKSNKEVAGALFLSVKTVERHIGNILTKLDVPSRAAATARAYENEVVGTRG